MKIHLLHTNDVHSHLENYMRIGAQLRTLRDQLRGAGEPLLTFDIGDVLDRVRPETEASGGFINSALMSALGYNGFIFGNNEGLTIPVQTWSDLVARAEVTAFGTNIRDASGEPLPWFSEWEIFQLEGVKIGVFGLTADYHKPYEKLHVKVLDPPLRARAVVEQLRQHGCDVVVLLSHLGLREDKALAAEVPGIDVILGGHTHQFMKSPEYVNRTAVFQPGKHALAFGHTVITFDPVQRTITRVESEAIPLNEHGPMDQAMLSAYHGYLPDVSEHLNMSVVHTEEALPVVFDQESPLANLLVDAMFAEYPCDLGIMMSGALTASLLAGDIRFSHLHGACTTPTRVLLLTLTGRQIFSIINQGLQADVYAQKGYGYGFRGSVIGFLALANTSAVVEVDSATQKSRLVTVSVGDTELHMDRPYRVVTCEYLWLAPIFKEFSEGTDASIEPPLVREILIEGMTHAKLRHSATQKRYHFRKGSNG